MRRSPRQGGVAGAAPNGSGRVARRAPNRRPPGNVERRAVPRPQARGGVASGYGGSYGRGRGRGNRSGYWYGYSSRGGYGYHRNGGRFGHRRGYGGRYFGGYSHPRVYGSYFYLPGFSFGLGYGYGSYGYLGYGGYGYGDPYGGYGYGYGYPYGGYGYYGGYARSEAQLYTGFLRLKVRPRFAEVYVDGYFVGVVNEYDGVFQRLRLEEGPHTVEVRHPGYEPLELDVLIVPGEKVTFEGDLIPQP